jgi:CRP-like cAMP-binding protein
MRALIAFASRALKEVFLRQAEMSMADIRETRNQVLRSLEPGDLDLISASLTPFEFKLGQTFESANAPIERVYFLESGLASIVARMLPRDDVEIGVASRENMTGAAIVLGDHRSPFECMAQIAGRALYIPSIELRAAMGKSATLSRHLLIFARAMSIQTGFTAHVNGHETILPRLARWLLMLHDRVDGDTFPVTHNLLATMLGVRRQSVTEALHILEGDHLIDAGRASIVLRNRKGLIVLAGPAYGAAEQEYTRLTGQPLAKYLFCNSL